MELELSAKYNHCWRGHYYNKARTECPFCKLPESVLPRRQYRRKGPVPRNWKIISCGNGHYFNPEDFPRCPMCEKEQQPSSPGRRAGKAWDITRCPHGHRYISSFHKSCPYCEEDPGRDPNDGYSYSIDEGTVITPTTHFCLRGHIFDPCVHERCPICGRRVPQDELQDPYTIMLVDYAPQIPQPVIGRLTCLDGPYQGVVWDLYELTNYIGQEDGIVQIFWDDTVAEEKHAAVWYSENDLSFTVLGSKGYRTEINKIPVEPPANILHDGDVLTVGSTRLFFQQLIETPDCAGNGSVQSAAQWKNNNFYPCPRGHLYKAAIQDKCPICGAVSSCDTSSVVQCPNGHQYNASMRTACPICGKVSAHQSGFETHTGKLMALDGTDSDAFWPVYDGYNYIGVMNRDQIYQEKAAMIAYHKRTDRFFAGPTERNLPIQVNDEPISGAVQIHPGDIITVGDIKLQLSRENEEIPKSEP